MNDLPTRRIGRKRISGFKWGYIMREKFMIQTDNRLIVEDLGLPFIGWALCQLISYPFFREIKATGEGYVWIVPL